MDPHLGSKQSLNNDNIDAHVLINNQQRQSYCTINIADYCTLSELRDKIDINSNIDKSIKYKFLYNGIIVQHRQESNISVAMTINNKNEILVSTKSPITRNDTTYERYVTPATPRHRISSNHNHSSDVNKINLYDTNNTDDANTNDFYTNSSPSHHGIPAGSSTQPGRPSIQSRFALSLPTSAPIHDINRSDRDIEGSDSDLEESKLGEKSSLLRDQTKRIMNSATIQSLNTTDAQHKYRSLDDSTRIHTSISPYTQPVTVRRIDTRAFNDDNDVLSKPRKRRISSNHTIDRQSTTPTLIPSHIPDRVDFHEFMSEDLIHQPSKRLSSVPATFKITVIGDRDLHDQRQQQPRYKHKPTSKAERRAQRHADTATRELLYTDVNQFIQSRMDEKRVIPQQQHMTFFDQAKQSAGAANDELMSVNESDRRIDAPLWICVEDGTDEIIRVIGEHFGLHSLTIEDCQSQGIREKLEVFPGYLFLVFHGIDTSDNRQSTQHNQYEYSIDISDTSNISVMKTTPLKLIVFGSCVLSFHKSNLSSIHVVQRQLRKLYRNKLENTAWLIHAVLDHVVDSMLLVVAGACRQVDEIDDVVYADDDELIPLDQSAAVHKDMLRKMCTIGRRLGFLRQRLWSKRDILMSLIGMDVI